ncbi:DUF3533 domain-containing protein [Paenibacillus sp. GD4]|uniref:YhgE/Pip domain-containing protein n=1 Tax=Paenibacillus sp. GD4 TaxID=3068890 RepID=UPI002796A66A|nr:DUF3533 domain-containing protein [Paenibacillus sp. GD4]MDQ1912175.1 DUF3533 domain-containing protein [Paenibacillus sp. GD4]
MKERSSLLRENMLWTSALIVLLVMMIFGLAMLGTVSSAKPKELPVALVVLDQEAARPGGGSVHIGKMLQEKLQSASQLPIRWTELPSEEAAVEGLDRQKYYAALVIGKDVSSGVISLTTPSAKPGTVKIYVNEGLHAQAAGAVKQILNQVMSGAGQEIGKQLLAQLGQAMPQVPASVAGALMTPFVIHEQTIHPIGVNHAGGNAPNLLTQLLWVGSMVSSILLFAAVQRSGVAWTWRSAATVLIAGLVIVTAADSLLMWMAEGWYGMELTNRAGLWSFMLLTGVAFFLMQFALLSWIGLPAMGLIVLTMFFAMPVIGMAPEFLPEAARVWLYSWVPLRFSSAGIRDLLYFGGSEPLEGAVTVLGWLGTGGLLLIGMLPLRKRKAAQSAASAGRI